MMVTISSSKKVHPVAASSFHIWSGKVSSKTKNAAFWEEAFIKINRASIKCFSSEIDDDEPTYVFNLQSVELFTQHYEDASHLVIITKNEPFLAEFSWKNMKDFQHVADSLKSHGIPIKPLETGKSKKKNPIKSASGTLGIELIAPKIPDIGTRLSRKFSRSSDQARSESQKKKVRFSVEQSESEAEEFSGQETFKRANFEYHTEGSVPVSRLAFEPGIEQEKFLEQTFEQWQHLEAPPEEEVEVSGNFTSEASSKSDANQEEEEDPTSDLIEPHKVAIGATTKISSIFTKSFSEQPQLSSSASAFEQQQKGGSLKRLKTLFASKEKAVYDIEVKPQESAATANEELIYDKFIGSTFDTERKIEVIEGKNDEVQPPFADDVKEVIGDEEKITCIEDSDPNSCCGEVQSDPFKEEADVKLDSIEFLPCQASFEKSGEEPACQIFDPFIDHDPFGFPPDEIDGVNNSFDDDFVFPSQNETSIESTKQESLEDLGAPHEQAEEDGLNKWKTLERDAKEVSNDISDRDVAQNDPRKISSSSEDSESHGSSINSHVPDSEKKLEAVDEIRFQSEPSREETFEAGILYAPKQGIFLPKKNRSRRVFPGDNALAPVEFACPPPKQDPATKLKKKTDGIKLKFLSKVKKPLVGSKNSKSLSLSDISQAGANSLRLGSSKTDSLPDLKRKPTHNSNTSSSELVNSTYAPPTFTLDHYIEKSDICVSDNKAYSSSVLGTDRQASTPEAPARRNKKKPQEGEEEEQVFEPLSRVPVQTAFLSLRRQPSQEEKVKKKPLLSRAVHKSIKRIKSADLTKSFKSQKRANTSIPSAHVVTDIDEPEFHVGNSSFFHDATPEVNEEDEGSLDENEAKDDRFDAEDDESENLTLVQDHEEQQQQEDQSSINNDEFFDPESSLEDLSRFAKTNHEPDSESSDTTFYSVASDPESTDKVVKFGLSLDIEEEDPTPESIDKLHEEAVKMSPPSKRSPMKKLKQLFRATSKDYELPHSPEFDSTAVYVDLPKISVNPIYFEGEMTKEIMHEEEDMLQEEPIIGAKLEPSTSFRENSPKPIQVGEEVIEDEEEVTHVFQRRHAPIFKGPMPMMSPQYSEMHPSATASVLPKEEYRVKLPSSSSEVAKQSNSSGKIALPQEPAMIQGYLELTTSLTCKWRRRFVKLHPKILYVLPRLTSDYATARVKLAKHRVENQPQDLTLSLVKRKKVTLYLKADNESDFREWIKTLQMVVECNQDDSQQQQVFINNSNTTFEVEHDNNNSFWSQPIHSSEPVYENPIEEDKITITVNSSEPQEIEEKRMPVPTPRTMPPELVINDDSITSEEKDQGEEEEEMIPEDWKDKGEVLVIKRCKPSTNLEESVKPWTQTIPEIPETSDEEPEVTAVNSTLGNNRINEPNIDGEAHLVDLEHSSISHNGEDFEFNVKDMKKFWEIATSPVKMSPIASPESSWKSMPNLAKDMATQTSTAYESSEEEDEEDSESEAETKEAKSSSNVLVPIEERKKAFLVHNSLSPSKLAWKSMPSLNKPATVVTKVQPLPLVGSGYPTRKEEITFDQPVKKMMATFEKPKEEEKSHQSPIAISQTRKRSTSLSSSSSLGSSILEQMPKPSASTTKLPVYKWDDESNGEIYTDRPLEELAASADQNNDSSIDSNAIGLYVVENGKEYPLLPLSQRKSLFEANPSVKISYKIATAKQTVTSTFQVKDDTKTDVAPPPPDSVKPIKDKPIGLSREAPVKSSSVPYILEEQEILKSINLVSKIKPKFSDAKK